MTRTLNSVSSLLRHRHQRSTVLAALSGIVLALVASACTSGVAPHLAEPPGGNFTAALQTSRWGPVVGHKLVICVVNTGSNSVSFVSQSGKQVSEPIPVGNSPYAVAVSPNGEWAYVANTGWGVTAGNTVTPINLITFQAAKPIKVGTGPFAIAVTPDGKWAYVANMGSMITTSSQAAGASLYAGTKVIDAHTVTPINLSTGRPAKAIDSGPGPGAVAITPDGKWAYVANSGAPNNYAGTVSGTVTPIDAASNTPGRPIPVGPGPMAIAITPDGQKAYVANAGWWNHPGHTVTPINLATNTPGKPIPVGAGPLGIAITPNGRWAYVANSGWGRADTVTPINLVTDTPGLPIKAGPGPDYIAITPDGRWAFVADGGSLAGPSDLITPIDLLTNKPARPIKVGLAPGALAIAEVPVFAHEPK